MRRGLIITLALLIWISGVGAAPADDGPMYVVGNGGSVRPMKNTSIRMAEETVQAICYSRFAEYKVDFRFENAGTTQTVLLGFPFDGPEYPPPFLRGDAYLAPAGFRAWQNGKPLAVALVHGEEDYRPVDYYTHRAEFAPGESTVTVDYLISGDVSRYTYSPKDLSDDTDGLVTTPPPAYRRETVADGEYDYILHTGSYWEGNIGTAVLRWTLSPDFIGWGLEESNLLISSVDTLEPDADAPTEGELLASRIQSSYTTPAPGVYQWTLHDFSPRIWPDEGFSPYDLGLYFFAPPLDPARGYSNQYRTPKVHASSSLKLGGYSYPAANLVDGDPSSAWAEAARGHGHGQWVDVSLPQTRHVRELRILPGYAKRPELFSKYNRPRTLRFEFSDGTSATVTLRDAPTLQRFAVDAITGTTRMTILDVYRGTLRDETYISEVEFGSAPAPDFEDPGVLLDAARGLPSADATPGADAATALSANASEATADAAPQSPASSSRIAWLALAGTLFGVTAVLVKLTP